MAECMDNAQEGSLESDWKKFSNNFTDQENEILALKSFYDNTGELEILQEADQSTNTLFALQIHVKLNFNTSPLTLQMCLPVDKIETKDLKEQNNLNYSLKRSLSGYHANTEIKCHSLPPIDLNIVIPASYPSQQAPIFSLHSIWLNRNQLSKLCAELDNISMANKEMTVIFTWIDFLQTNALSLLGLDEEDLAITPMDIDEDESFDNRAHSEYDDFQRCIFEILRYSFIEELKLFRNSMQTCPLCFDERYGSEFIRMNNCKHFFCMECFRGFCKMHVQEGSVNQLRCPERKCEEIIGDYILQEVLDDEELMRWQRLTLQKALDTMQDLMYCPKCSSPIIIDENDTHLTCMDCRVDLCKTCKENWHLGPCLTVAQRIQKVKDIFKMDPSDFLKMSDEDIRKRFKNHDFAFVIKRKIEEKSEEDKTKEILKNFQKCPKCKMLVDKFDGCNFIHCRCGAGFCYLCGAGINSYSHFSDKGCVLFRNRAMFLRMNVEYNPNQQAIQRVLHLMPEQRANLVKCPTCAQGNLKKMRNNHVKCWLCSTNFCFCCKHKITGVITSHFRNGTCKQHSD